ncbi:MAG TPA: hypothetical protein VGD45_23000 [Steroidobacter sp.]|uniref:hypothetical protein n=1 Tax=Steroidobacter sp. TaxID=1978227 RepID=UPI002EDAFCE9
MSSLSALDAHLYLPISEQQLSLVLDESVDLEQSIATLDAPQLASLIVLHSLPSLPIEQASRAEYLLSHAIQLVNAQTAEVGLADFRRGLSSELERVRVNVGYRLIDDYGIALLEHELVGWRSYLNENHEWDPGFCERHRQRLHEPLQGVVLPSGEDRLLTSQQSGVYRTVVAQSDDHLHVQGYAGSGKSLLIHALLDLLRSKERQVLVLAERPRQLRALMAGIEGFDRVDGLTFGQLATQITPADLIHKGQRGMYYENNSRNPMYDEVMVRHLGVHPVGDFSAIQLVQLARRTVAAFCSTGDRDIGEQHLPAELQDPVARQVVLHHSSELWMATIAPGASDFRPPLRAVHRIKLAALQQWKIPAKYTHILLDECHDLSKPLLQILDVSRQAAISFGDEYQHLRGRAYSRASTIRRCLITHSVRSAKAIEAIANPLIQAHPGETKDPFLGHRKFRAEVMYYSALEIPTRPVTILAQDLWELFDWAQRLAAGGLTIRPLSDFARLGQWVEDCIELYSRGTRPRDASLFRFHSWDDVRRTLGRHRGFQKFDELLQKGYQREHWARTANHVDPRASGGYALGLIEDVRNLEFPEVMLAPNVVADLWSELPTVRATASSLVYVAVTRAQHRLLVPKMLREWIEERGSAAPVVRYESAPPHRPRPAR